MRCCHLALLLLVGVVYVQGYKHFQKQIPNGDWVPDPATANGLWGGVGHTNAKGGTTRNAFGLDFQANGFKWDACLCRRDSDKDGLTNGQELGDPDCVWTLGELPATKLNITHPGICEPLDSEICLEMNDDIDFTASQTLVCPQMEQPNVTQSIFRFDPTEVPAEVTNYFCQYFPLNIPSGEKQHIIAYEPIIDNEEVMHHTLVYGCRDAEAKEMASQNFTTSMDCSEGMSSCNEIVLLWTLGINGICHDEAYGVLIGEGGYTALWMEHHWNNPRKVSGMIDSSGIKLYHTAHLRASNAAFMLWGTSTLELPVGVEDYVQTGGCPSTCTDFVPDYITISQIIPHMHYYGRKMSVRHKRPGEFERTIFVDNNYAYDNPVVHSFDVPIEFKRGDEIQVNCSYTTTSATSPTYFGLGTSDEMCFMIALVHPYDGSVPVVCTDSDGHGFCNEKMFGDFDNCDAFGFLRNQQNFIDIYTKLIAVCDVTGVTCMPGCKDAVAELKESYSCLNSSAARLVRGFLQYGGANSVLNMMISCTGESYVIHNEKAKEEEAAVGMTTPKTTPNKCVFDQGNHDDGDKECDGVACGSNALLASLYITLLTIITNHFL